MTEVAICEAAQGLIGKTEAINRLMFRMAKMCGRSGLTNLRRELEVAMRWCKEIENGLKLEAVQEELSRLQMQRDSIQAQPAEPEPEAKGA